MFRFIKLHRFPLTGGWSLWIGNHIHIYHWSMVTPRWRRYGITWVR